MSLRLEYLSVAQVERATEIAEHGLGLMVYGEALPASSNVAMRAMTVALPWLHQDRTVCELWRVCDPDHDHITRGQVGGVSYTSTQDWLLGEVRLQQGNKTLQDLTQQAYCALFNATEALNFPHLVRCWNYFSDMTELEEGLERYQHFNIGRQKAFVDHQRSLTFGVPAASAMGTLGDEFVVHFLATRTPVRALENPRQVSAYHYPARYGPRSPTFSRATLVHDTLFISGTASIVGHASVHPGDVVEQTHEILRNIQALLDEANQGAEGPWTMGRLLCKVYVRHAKDAPLIERVLAQKGLSRFICLLGDICRPELLLEIEATGTLSS